MALILCSIVLCALPLMSQAAVSAAERAEFLKIHNDYRAALAGGSYGGPATDMQELQWDADLAAGAQAWADTCAQGHDSDSARQSASKKTSYVGQNAAWGYGTIAAAAAGWWDEYKCTVFPSNVPGGYPVSACNCQYGCGHFTQMAWTATTHVGCGINTACSMKTYFCNYYPGGNFNWRGRQDYVYRKGTACTNCAASGGSASQKCLNNMCQNSAGGSQPVPQPTPRPVAPTPRPVTPVTQPTPRPVTQPTPRPVVQPTPRPTTPPPVDTSACPTSSYNYGYSFYWYPRKLNGNQQLVQDGWNSIKYGGCFKNVKIIYATYNAWYDRIDVTGTNGYFYGTSAMRSDLRSNLNARKAQIENYVKARVGASAAGNQGSKPAAPAAAEKCSPSPCNGASSSGSEPNKVNVGLIVGVVVGAIVLCCLVAGGVYFMMQQKKKSRFPDDERLLGERTPYQPPIVS